MINLNELYPGNEVQYKGHRYIYLGTCLSKTDGTWLAYALYWGKDTKHNGDCTFFSRELNDFRNCFEKVESATDNMCTKVQIQFILDELKRIFNEAAL